MPRTIDADVLKAVFEEDGHLSPYIEEFIDTCPTVGGWISVEDRLPEDQKKILVVDGHGYVEILSLWKKENDRWTWLDSTGHFNHKNDVTHWMHLPEPPKEK